jgi:nucleotide-binding universal stress UspA family protein
MRALVWITESSWPACVDRARELLPVDATDAEALAEHSARGLLGRHHPRPPGPTVRQISDEEAASLLREAARRLDRPAETVARRGRVEREVLEAAADADVLVLGRDGEPRREPKSVGREARFVLDHAGCTVLLAWSQEPPPLHSVRWPPHLR